MAFVRHQIERGGERLWKLEDFRDLPFMAAASKDPVANKSRKGTPAVMAHREKMGVMEETHRTFRSQVLKATKANPVVTVLTVHLAKGWCERQPRSRRS